MSLQQRQKEYEQIKKARGEAEQAIRIVDDLQRQDEKNQLWQSFINNWNSWLPQLQSFLELSRQFDASQINNPAGLALQAQQKLSSYQSWTIQLSEDIMNAVEISVEKDLLKTEIGLWVQQLESQNSTITEAQQRLLEQLKDVGQSMGSIFDYFEIDEPELAQETYSLEIKPSVLAVEKSIKQVLPPIEQALGIQRTMQSHALTVCAPLVTQAQSDLHKIVSAERQAMMASTEQAASTAGRYRLCSG